MNAPESKKNDTLLWISLVVFGLVGITVGKWWRPGPIADAFVEVTPEVRILVEEAPAPGDAAVVAASDASDADASNANASNANASDGSESTEPVPPKRLWVDPSDASTEARLKDGTFRRVPDTATEVWDVRSKVDPETARKELARLEADAERLSVPTDPMGLSKEEFDRREAERMSALKAVESTRIVRSPRDSIGIWIGALLTLGILSFLVRDNPFYKVVESILIGVSAAYWMLVAFWSTLVPDLFAKLAPDLVRATMVPGLAVSEHPTKDFLLALVPLGLAIMLLWRLMPKGGWIAVWPLAVVIGTFAGMRLTASIEADFMAQIAATMKPLVATKEIVPDATTATAAGAATEVAAEAATEAAALAAPATQFDLSGTVGAILGLVGVVTVLVYFFFSLEHRGVVGKTARVGVWFLMITFGAAFGLTVMGRITLLAGRFEFLFTDWLGLRPPM